MRLITERKNSVLLVGSFLSAHTGARSVGEELAGRLEQNDWQVIQTSHQPSRLVRLLDMLSTAYRKRHGYQVAYVEVYSGMAFLWAEMAVRLLARLRKPVLLALHGGRLAEFSQQHQERFTALLNRANVVVTPSQFLLEFLPSDVHAIRYLPNALDVGHYPYQLRRSVTPRVVWLRALHSIYQPELAVQAVALLRNEFEDIHLTMIGPDKGDGSLPRIQRLIQENHLQGNVSIVGAVSKREVPEWLARGDIFLNTTRYESFGVSVLEAALVGLPIVTTAVGELPRLWQDRETALLVPPGDPQAMADAIRHLLTEPGLAEKLSANARHKAEEFDWAIILPQWEALFEELIRSANS